ncbi:hypothetical protein Tco_0885388 [Tanacetum coccineum]
MSTSNVHQQSLADVSSNTRPPMPERGSYIPWASRFQRYLNRKRETRQWLNKVIDEGPYEFRIFTPSKTEAPRLQKEEDLRGDDLKHYEVEIEEMNLILIYIPNNIYNYVDACTTAKSMWQCVERLMRETVQNQFDRETRFNNKFDQFVAKPGKALVSVYNHFSQFLNCLQPKWLKYVTQVRLVKRLTEDSYDDLFDYLQQFEKLVSASRAKKLEKSHDPLALVAHTGDTVQNNFEDPLTSAMILIARAITRNFSNPSNNQIQDVHMFKRKLLRVTMFRMMLETFEELFELRLQELLQMFNATTAVRKATMLVIIQSQESGIQKIKELSANICLMARIQPADIDSDARPSYDSAFLSEVQIPSTSYVNPLFANDYQEQKYSMQPKIINKSIGDDQIDSNIIFDEPNEDVNSSNVENDNNV